MWSSEALGCGGVQQVQQARNFLWLNHRRGPEVGLAGRRSFKSRVVHRWYDQYHSDLWSNNAKFLSSFYLFLLQYSLLIKQNNHFTFTFELRYKKLKLPWLLYHHWYDMRIWTTFSRLKLSGPVHMPKLYYCEFFQLDWLNMDFQDRCDKHEIKTRIFESNNLLFFGI